MHEETERIKPKSTGVQWQALWNTWNILPAFFHAVLSEVAPDIDLHHVIVFESILTQVPKTFAQSVLYVTEMFRISFEDLEYTAELSVWFILSLF